MRAAVKRLSFLLMIFGYAKSRYRNVTICARVQVSFGLNVVALVPFVTFPATAQKTASV